MSRYRKNSPPQRGALVVTACLPVPEALRDSLQSHLTWAQSTALYRRFLADILETTQNVEGMDYYLAYTPRGSRGTVAAVAPDQFRLIYQEGGTTSVRLAKLFQRLFDRGYERVVALCSNHPDLPACMINQAVEALEKKTAGLVFGPNERGRFYLLGLDRPQPSLFQEVDWDAPHLEARLGRWARQRRAGLHILPAWYDIGSVADLRRHLSYHSLRESSPASASLPSETGRYLARIRDRIEATIC